MKLTYLSLASALLSIMTGCSILPAEDGLAETNSDGALVADSSVQSFAHVINVGAEAPLLQEGKPTEAAADLSTNQASQSNYRSRSGEYRGKALSKHVGDYVQSMTQDLIANIDYVNDAMPVGVSHFALLDSDLQKTNLLGYQLAESFVHELRKFRIHVVDYKATDYIRVTEQGDFLLSRDFLELQNQANVDYILTGTLVRHQGGYLVNARMLGLKDKAVVSTAQRFIPYYVVDALLPSDMKTLNGVKLIKG